MVSQCMIYVWTKERILTFVNQCNFCIVSTIVFLSSDIMTDNLLEQNVTLLPGIPNTKEFDVIPPEKNNVTNCRITQSPTQSPTTKVCIRCKHLVCLTFSLSTDCRLRPINDPREYGEGNTVPQLL